MYRPLHLFGTVGMLSLLGGLGIASWLMLSKLIWHLSVMGEHGPLLISAAVLIVFGGQMLALGLLGDLQVRNFRNQLDECHIPWRTCCDRRARNKRSRVIRLLKRIKMTPVTSPTELRLAKRMARLERKLP